MSYAQQIVRRAEKEAADLELYLDSVTEKKTDNRFGIITRHLADGSIVVCDQSGHHAPRWYVVGTTEWCDEGQAAEDRIKQTQGTVWVVRFGASNVCAFESQARADGFFQKQMHDKLSAYEPVRYVDGVRQITSL
jgi:hypothetical protein